MRPVLSIVPSGSRRRPPSHPLHAASVTDADVTMRLSLGPSEPRGRWLWPTVPGARKSGTQQLQLWPLPVSGRAFVTREFSSTRNKQQSSGQIDPALAVFGPKLPMPQVDTTLQSILEIAIARSQCVQPPQYLAPWLLSQIAVDWRVADHKPKSAVTRYPLNGQRRRLRKVGQPSGARRLEYAGSQKKLQPGDR